MRRRGSAESARAATPWRDPHQHAAKTPQKLLRPCCASSRVSCHTVGVRGGGLPLMISTTVDALSLSAAAALYRCTTPSRHHSGSPTRTRLTIALDAFFKPQTQASAFDVSSLPAPASPAAPAGGPPVTAGACAPDLLASIYPHNLNVSSICGSPSLPNKTLLNSTLRAFRDGSVRSAPETMHNASRAQSPSAIVSRTRRPRLK